MPNEQYKNRALTISTWCYRLLLHAYPSSFRHDFGERMIGVFRDSCRTALQQHNIQALIAFWLHTSFDILISSCLEQWSVVKEKIYAMTTSTNERQSQLHLRVARATTLFAFIASLAASLHLYLLEDASPLTQTAYAASPILRFSYDATYITTLAAAVAVCSIVGYALLQRTTQVAISISIISLLIAFGGFGGLLIRHPMNFLMLFSLFVALVIISFLLGQVVAKHAAQRIEKRRALMLGACVSVGSILLINIAALILHTILLNPVSHALYMQGQIAGTHWNSLLIAMVAAFLAMIICGGGLKYALRFPALQS
ncbi:MAG TPA: hypothetical protein VL461_12335 [Dictyobacter sp.]|jgi:hypothetical protein|nr:hypothetical protein [Dictyobacter sp.]